MGQGIFQTEAEEVTSSEIMGIQHLVAKVTARGNRHFTQDTVSQVAGADELPAEAAIDG